MKREAHDRSLRLKALTVAVTLALTGAAQAAVTIPESCPEGANGNCVRMTKEGELTKLHLSGQGWGPANVDKSVGILNKEEGDDHDLTVIADFEADTAISVMLGGQAFTKVQGTRTDPTRPDLQRDDQWEQALHQPARGRDHDGLVQKRVDALLVRG